MLAAYYGHAELVKFLIQHGADPNRLNDRLQSPLAGAVFKKEEDVIKVSLVIAHPLPFYPLLGVRARYPLSTQANLLVICPCTCGSTLL